MDGAAKPDVGETGQGCFPELPAQQRDDAGRIAVNRVSEIGGILGIQPEVVDALLFQARDHEVGSEVVPVANDQQHQYRSSSLIRSEEHTSELQSLMRISYAVFCLQKKNDITHKEYTSHHTKRTHT